MGPGVVVIEDAEEAVLAGFGVALDFLGLLHGLVEDRGELGAAAEGVHGATLNQRFEHSLVEQAEIDVFAELEDRFEAAEFLARGDDRFDSVAADVLDSRETEADRLA